MADYASKSANVSLLTLSFIRLKTKDSFIVCRQRRYGVLIFSIFVTMERSQASFIVVFALVCGVRQTKRPARLFANVTVFALSYASIGRQLFSSADKLRLRDSQLEVVRADCKQRSVNVCQAVG